jgi:DNA gyrase/topoisomerase IV subunit A
MRSTVAGSGSGSGYGNINISNSIGGSVGSDSDATSRATMAQSLNERQMYAHTLASSGVAITGSDSSSMSTTPLVSDTLSSSYPTRPSLATANSAAVTASLYITEEMDNAALDGSSVSISKAQALKIQREIANLKQQIQERDNRIRERDSKNAILVQELSKANKEVHDLRDEVCNSHSPTHSLTGS